MARYRHLTQRHRTWFVRIIVPADVQAIVGQTVLIETTGETDVHRAATRAAPIIARFKAQIRAARLAGKPLEELTAERLADRYRAESATDPDHAQAIEITDVVRFALRQIGQSYTAYGRQVREADYDGYAALGLLPRGERAMNVVEAVTGRSTPFDVHLEQWVPDAGLKSRPLDQAISTIRSFARDVGRPLQGLRGRDVQAWIDGLINAEGVEGTSAKTVQRKLSELRNYWNWLQSKEIVPDDLKPFTGRRVRQPASRRKLKAEQRQRWRPDQVIQLWEAAKARRDAPLAHAIQIAAYSGARIEGVAQLRVQSIETDPETGVRFMRMTDKSAAGDRHVPVHPQLAGLIDSLIQNADGDGYLIHSTARNKYGERSQPLSKRFGRLKTELGFDERYVFHSIRRTVAKLFQDAGCPEGVAADIVGHLKPTLTYGLYGGETRMDTRAEWLARAIVYPPIKNASAPSTGSNKL
jgi:integrase